MEIDVRRVCCFTGHRPQKCFGSEESIRLKLIAAINEAIQNGYDTFVTGMAEGVDVWAADEVLKIKKEHEKIKLICAVPFEGVEKNRTEEQKNTFRKIIASADNVAYVCPKYRPWCFSARNQWMVDHASMVIAVFNGTPGGTEATIQYAHKKERKIVLLNDVKEY